MRTRIEAVARALCVARGINPDYVGVPPNEVGIGVYGSAFPNWMSLQAEARAAINAADASAWQPIETAPREGGVILCRADGWDEPLLLIWKTNDRITNAKAAGDPSVADWVDSYWGDRQEWDDYDFAKPGGQPTHWLPAATIARGR